MNNVIENINNDLYNILKDKLKEEINNQNIEINKEKEIIIIIFKYEQELKNKQKLKNKIKNIVKQYNKNKNNLIIRFWIDIQNSGEIYNENEYKIDYLYNNQINEIRIIYLNNCFFIKTSNTSIMINFVDNNFKIFNIENIKECNNIIMEYIYNNLKLNKNNLNKNIDLINLINNLVKF